MEPTQPPSRTEETGPNGSRSHSLPNGAAEHAPQHTVITLPPMQMWSDTVSEAPTSDDILARSRRRRMNSFLRAREGEAMRRQARCLAATSPSSAARSNAATEELGPALPGSSSTAAPPASSPPPSSTSPTSDRQHRREHSEIITTRVWSDDDDTELESEEELERWRQGYDARLARERMIDRANRTANFLAGGMNNLTMNDETQSGERLRRRELERQNRRIRGPRLGTFNLTRTGTVVGSRTRVAATRDQDEDSASSSAAADADAQGMMDTSADVADDDALAGIPPRSPIVMADLARCTVRGE